MFKNIVDEFMYGLQYVGKGYEEVSNRYQEFESIRGEDEGVTREYKRLVLEYRAIEVEINILIDNSQYTGVRAESKDIFTKLVYEGRTVDSLIGGEITYDELDLRIVKMFREIDQGLIERISKVRGDTKGVLDNIRAGKIKKEMGIVKEEGEKEEKVKEIPKELTKVVIKGVRALDNLGEKLDEKVKGYQGDYEVVKEIERVENSLLMEGLRIKKYLQGDYDELKELKEYTKGYKILDGVLNKRLNIEECSYNELKDSVEYLIVEADDNIINKIISIGLALEGIVDKSNTNVLLKEELEWIERNTGR